MFSQAAQNQVTQLKLLPNTIIRSAKINDLKDIVNVMNITFN